MISPIVASPERAIQRGVAFRRGQKCRSTPHRFNACPAFVRCQTILLTPAKWFSKVRLCMAAPGAKAVARDVGQALCLRLSDNGTRASGPYGATPATTAIPTAADESPD